MIKRYQNSAGVLTRIADTFIVGISWVVAYPVRFQLLQLILPGEVERPEISKYYALIPLVLILWAASFQTFGVYRYDRVLRRSTEIFTLIRAHLATLVLFTALTYFITQYRFSRGVILVFGAEVLLASFLFRVIFRKILRILHRRGVLDVPMVMVGEGGALKKVILQIQKYPELGISILDTVGPDRYQSLISIIEFKKPKIVLVALPHLETQLLHRTIQQLKDFPTEVMILPDFSDFFALGATVDRFEGIPLIQLNESPLIGWHTWLKRCFDLACSFAALVLLSPLFLLIAVLIRLTSQGPIFYGQQRMGLDGVTFKMLKFRSMRVDQADTGTGQGWTVKDDQRRTWIGKILRSTSLDELPQLWNVCKGEMSLVGPRPEQPYFVEKFKADIPNYMLRHKVKAGITGWAQINGWRGDTSLEKRIECDLYYIRNWSLWLDFKIIILTFFKGFIHKNAY